MERTNFDGTFRYQFFINEKTEKKASQDNRRLAVHLVGNYQERILRNFFKSCVFMLLFQAIVARKLIWEAKIFDETLIVAYLG